MRIRSLIAGAALVATIAAAFMMPTQSTLAQADGFLRCFHLYVPVISNGTVSPAMAGIWDYEKGEYIEFHFNRHESNNSLDYYFALSDEQAAFVWSLEGYSAVRGTDIETDKLLHQAGKVEEVDWSFCDGSISDGRLNGSDLGALAYVYPSADGYAVWELNLGDMKGYEQFDVSFADIAAALATANETGENQQIGETERGTTLWALAGGQCQMNHFELDGKINEFAFDCA